MKKYLQLFFLLTFCVNLPAQNLEEIFTNVDTLFCSVTYQGHLKITSQNVTPIVSDSPCNNFLVHYAVINTYQNGKVMGIGNEGILTDDYILEYDNLTFFVNALNWLNSGEKRVLLKEEYINGNNTTILQNALTADNFTFNTFAGDISDTALGNADILIIANDFNDNTLYTNSEINALENFIANGGSLLLTGDIVTWAPQTNYPMNQIANLFGFEYSNENTLIWETQKFYNFYPDNLNPNIAHHCPAPYVGTNIARGDYLRVLRLAISTNGEFTQQNGGVNQTITSLEAWVDEINDIFGREYCVRFEIIPNNNLLIFDNPNTDPWNTLPSGSGGCTNSGIIVSQQETVIDNIIGAENYDISHVAAGPPYGGGCADLGDLKAAVSGGLDISVTRHEIGHQFSQYHTINNGGTNNYEPENGAWTMQGGNGQPYAHAVSYHELADFLLNTIPNTGVKVPTGNTIPTVNAGQDVYIPVSTPFTLTGVANDPDAEDNLTYVWDNMSRAHTQFIPVTDDKAGALFMRLLPTDEPSRTFPRMSDVIANNNANEQEQLPTQPRYMDFRLTVNDNHKMNYNGETINASGINSDDILVTVADAGPFIVTSQSETGIMYMGGTEQTVTWEVNGTDQAPINTQTVSISLSVDGGYTYPIIVTESTPNTGTATVTIPNGITTETARIKVAANNSIYFDINTVNFEIQSTLSASNEAISSEIKVYPNPSKDFFTIEFNVQRNFKAELFDTIGKLVAEQVNEKQFNTKNLPEGLYLLKITDTDTSEKAHKKIIIQRN